LRLILEKDGALLAFSIGINKFIYLFNTGVDNLRNWEPINYEDILLYKYWKKSKGKLFLEVPIGNKQLGNWPPNSKIRRIDAVLIKAEDGYGTEEVFNRNEYTLSEFNNYVKDKTVELIEVKKNLNRLVIGQVIAGLDMFERQYNAKKVLPVVISQNDDPALQWVCEKRDIKVCIINDIS